MDQTRPRIPGVVAHRGYQRCHPENTLAAIRAAIDCGARFVEVDVHLTADGVPVLLHDESLRRVCGVRGLVHLHSFAQLRRLRASERERLGDRFPDEPVASLRECVELVAGQPGVGLFVELKESAARRFGDERVLASVLPILEPVRDRCVVIAFSESLLRGARDRGGFAIGPVIRNWRRKTIVDRFEGRAEYLFCDLRGLPPSGSLGVEGVRVAVYEVGNAVLAMELAARGVDLVETFSACELIRELGAANSGEA